MQQLQRQLVDLGAQAAAAAVARLAAEARASVAQQEVAQCSGLLAKAQARLKQELQARARLEQQLQELQRQRRLAAAAGAQEGAAEAAGVQSTTSTNAAAGGSTALEAGGEGALASSGGLGRLQALLLRLKKKRAARGGAGGA